MSTPPKKSPIEGATQEELDELQDIFLHAFAQLSVKVALRNMLKAEGVTLATGGVVGAGHRATHGDEHPKDAPQGQRVEPPRQAVQPPGVVLPAEPAGAGAGGQEEGAEGADVRVGLRVPAGKRDPLIKMADPYHVGMRMPTMANIRAAEASEANAGRNSPAPSRENPSEYESLGGAIGQAIDIALMVAEATPPRRVQGIMHRHCQHFPVEAEVEVLWPGRKLGPILPVIQVGIICIHDPHR